jgi:hypothetical protein
MWLFKSYRLVIAMLQPCYLHKCQMYLVVKLLCELLEEVDVVPDAQSAPNEVEISRLVRGVCGALNPVVPTQEVPLTQDPTPGHPSKCL